MEQKIKSQIIFTLNTRASTNNPFLAIMLQLVLVTKIKRHRKIEVVYRISEES